MKFANSLSYYRHRADEARSRAEAAQDPSIREFFETLSERYQNIAANLMKARRPRLSLRLDGQGQPPIAHEVKTGRRTGDYVAG
jgi:hypothetical protein